MFIRIFILAISCLSPWLQAAEPIPVSALYGQEQDLGRVKITSLPLKLQSQIEVQEINELKHARMYLQDIAICKGSSTLCQDILAIDLGPSPKPGQEKILAEQDLRKALAIELPEQQISIQIPTRVRLQASALPLDSTRIREKIEQNLQALDGPYRFTLVTLRLPVGLRLRHENYRVDFPSWTQDFSFVRQNPRRSLVNVMVRLVDQDSGSTEHFDLTAQVVLRAEVQAAVVVRAMERGQLLAQDAIVFQWVPYQENIIRDAAGLEKQLLRSTARPGLVLRSFDLNRDPDVKRGEKVEASVVANGVKMNSSAQAMESAAVGQRIRIQLDTTKRQVMATVIGPSQVEVHMP